MLCYERKMKLIAELKIKKAAEAAFFIRNYYSTRIQI